MLASFRENIHFERLKGRRGPALSNMFDDFIIFELKSGQIYAGVVDEYYYNHGGVLAVISCKLLDKFHRKWVDHDILLRKDGQKRRDFMPSFRIAQIRHIWVLKDSLKDSFSEEDALQLFIDPHFRPLPWVKCPWRGRGSHSKDCDSSLHEALSLLYQEAIDRKNYEEKQLHRVEESFSKIRRRLILSGAKIP